MEQISLQALQEKVRQLGRAAIALVVIVGAQVVALEVVLRAWQGMEAMMVFVGIGVSGLLCALAVIIFLWTKQKRLQ
jgi:hypothetical protein